MSTKKQDSLGVAVVGAGDMGQTHMRHIAEIPWLKIRAVADVDASRAAEHAGRLEGCAWTQDYREAVARPDVDVVLVCVPTAFHAEVVVEAARHGKEIFCEKPLALSLSDGQRMIAAAKEAGVRLGINFCMRFMEAHRYLRNCFQERRFGRPVYYAQYMAAGVRPKLAMHDQSLNGGPFMDILCHYVDLWRFLFDSEPCHVYARGAVFAQGKPSVTSVRRLAADTGAVVVEFRSGDVGCFNVCWGLPEGTEALQRHLAVAPLALLEIDPASAITIRSGGQKSEVVSGLQTDAQREQIRHFAHGLRDGQPPCTTGEDGLIALQVSLAALESIRSGKAITIGSQ